MICPSCSHPVPDGFRFCGQCGAQLVVNAATAAPSAVQTPRDERREVAVLFADISGFTTMSERLDPEEVHDIMNRCFGGLGRAITDEGGYIDKYIGDNVMALFGAPVAHEDDAARACRAALAMQAFVHRFAAELHHEKGVTLRMRIGIHHGMVIAGRVGSEGKKDYTVMGDTVNVAARLESAAPIGGVLVSEPIHQRTCEQFNFREPEHFTVKGRRTPVTAFALLEERRRVTDSTDCIAMIFGRENHQRTLREMLYDGAGAPRWVDVRGELGIGKTHLVQSLAHHTPPLKIVRVAATASAARRPFGVVRLLIHEILLAYLGGNIGSALDDTHAFAEAMTTFSPQLEAFVPALWHIAAPSHTPVHPPDPDPQAMRRTVECGITTMLHAVAQHWPHVVLFLDSYEHADEPSADLLESLGEHGHYPMPIIAAARLDAARPTRDATMVLGPLEPDAANRMLDTLLSDAAPSPAVRSAILRRAANIPLFIETLAQAVRDVGEADEPLPSSLRSALVSRLDRLSRDQRDLLCQCAVQGVEFDLDVAEYVRRDPPWQGPAVLSLLTPLQRAGVVTAVGVRQRRRALFRVPLFQEACYHTLLQRDCRSLHARIATALIEVAGSAENVAAELLAHHHESAEQWRDAAAAYVRAGDRAAALYLNDDALRIYDRAVDLLTRDAGALPPLAAQAHAGAAQVLLRIGRYDEAERRALLMSQLAGDGTARVESRRLLAAVCEHTGRTQRAESLLREAVDEDAACADGDVLSRAWYDLAHLLHRAGRMDEAMQALAQCRALPRIQRPLMLLRADLLEGLIQHTLGRLERASSFYRSGCERARAMGALAQEARGSNGLGNVTRDAGDYHAAAAHYQHALDLWTRIGDSVCIAGVRNNLGNLAMSQGSFDDARQHYDASLAAASRIGNIHAIATAHANLGILALECGDADAAVTSADAAVKALATAENHVLRALVLVVLGDGQRMRGQLDAAYHTFTEVLREYAQHPLAVATANRGLGRIAADRGEHLYARQQFELAIAAFAELSRAQEEHRTRIDLAETLLVMGDHAAARDHAERAHTALRAINAHYDADRAQSLRQRIP